MKTATNIFSFWVIVAVGSVLTLPGIPYGAVQADDTRLHLVWSRYFAEQLWAGDLYPRWLLNMNAGFGSPTFFFYPPLPYYFTSLFHPLQIGSEPVWSRLVLSAALAMIASGFASYLWLKDFSDRKAALVGSVVYMTLPYHWSIDLYERFAFAEFWTFVWMPLILYFSRKIVVGHRLAVPGFALSYACLVMTHLPTTLVFSVVPVGYVFFLTDGRQRIGALGRTFVAASLGVGLSAIYLVPAMTTQEYVALQGLATGEHFYYANNFLLDPGSFAGRELDKAVVYMSLLVLLMGAVCYFAFVLAREIPDRATRRESGYWLGVAAVSILMMLPLSAPIWRLLPTLQIIQFPWRFHVVLTVATTPLVALGAGSLLQAAGSISKRKLWIGAPLLVGTLASGVLVAYATVNRLAVDSEAMLIRSRDAPEYRPQWVSRETFRSDSLTQLATSSPDVEVTAGTGTVRIERWQPRTILLRTNASTDVTLMLQQLYYPGWMAKVRGGRNRLRVGPSRPDGLLHVNVPRGRHEVTVQLAPLAEERLGRAISGISALLVVALAFGLPGTGRLRRGNRRTGHP